MIRTLCEGQILVPRSLGSLGSGGVAGVPAAYSPTYPGHPPSPECPSCHRVSLDEKVTAVLGGASASRFAHNFEYWPSNCFQGILCTLELADLMSGGNLAGHHTSSAAVPLAPHYPAHLKTLTCTYRRGIYGGPHPESESRATIGEEQPHLKSVFGPGLLDTSKSLAPLQ